MRNLNFSRIALLAGGAVLASSLVACAPYRQGPASYPASSYPASSYPAGTAYPSHAPLATEYGRVSHIEVLQGSQRGQATGAGAVIGAVVGGVLGNQVGGGSGRAAATAVGVVGGAVVGNAIEERNSGGGGYATGYRITIRLDQGGQRAYDVNSVGDLRVGDRVRMDNGQISRY